MNIKLGNKEYNISKKEILMSIIILLLIAAIIIVNSMKSKKIECTSIRSNTTVNVEEKITALFKNKKLSKITFNYKTALTDDYLYMLDEMYELLNGQMVAYKNAGGHDYTITKGDNYILYNSIFDISKISDETKQKMGYDENWTYKDVKEDLERNKFSCK